jgi:ABC-2 type transport system ATP-binding protein
VTVVSAVDIDQGYGKKQVISGLCLDLEEGVFGLLGPNGAGKTTLLRTLATVSPPRRGRLQIDGTSVESERSVRGARRKIGYLPQNFGFYPGFSVYDFVRYCAWLREVPRDQAHDGTVTAIRSVGLADRSRSKMKSLSGGMLRRAGIASAIVGAPRLLLLDEPTVGLDPAQRLDFRQMVRGIAGTAVILSTHLVEDVAAVCDQVAIIESGRFNFRGTPDDLSRLATPLDDGDTPIERGYMAALRSTQLDR